MVVGFEHCREAEPYGADRKRRLARFGLERPPTQTRLIEFGRYAAANRRGRGWGKPEMFDFLGRTHFCTVTRTGRFRLGRQPARKRRARTLRQIRELLRKRWHVDKQENARWLGWVLRGGLHYYAVPGSYRYLRALVHTVKRLFRRGRSAPAVPKGPHVLGCGRSADPALLAARPHSPPVAPPTAGRLTGGRSRMHERARPDRCGRPGATRVPTAIVQNT